jgi:hypothetical protein
VSQEVAKTGRTESLGESGLSTILKLKLLERDHTSQEITLNLRHKVPLGIYSKFPFPYGNIFHILLSELLGFRALSIIRYSKN